MAILTDLSQSLLAALTKKTSQSVDDLGVLQQKQVLDNQYSDISTLLDSYSSSGFFSNSRETQLKLINFGEYFFSTDLSVPGLAKQNEKNLQLLKDFLNGSKGGLNESEKSVLKDFFTFTLTQSRTTLLQLNSSEKDCINRCLDCLCQNDVSIDDKLVGYKRELNNQLGITNQELYYRDQAYLFNYESQTVDDFVKLLNEKAVITSFDSELDVIKNVMEYLQSNFTYQAENTNKDNWQSFEETLKLGKGDCEDLSILVSNTLSNIFHTQFGYSKQEVAAMISLTAGNLKTPQNNSIGHAMVKINLKQDDESTKTFYLDATSKVGVIPQNVIRFDELFSMNNINFNKFGVIRNEFKTQAALSNLFLNNPLAYGIDPNDPYYAELLSKTGMSDSENLELYEANKDTIVWQLNQLLINVTNKVNNEDLIMPKQYEASLYRVLDEEELRDILIHLQGNENTGLSIDDSGNLVVDEDNIASTAAIILNVLAAFDDYKSDSYDELSSDISSLFISVELDGEDVYPNTIIDSDADNLEINRNNLIALFEDEEGGLNEEFERHEEIYNALINHEYISADRILEFKNGSESQKEAFLALAGYTIAYASLLRAPSAAIGGSGVLTKSALANKLGLSYTVGDTDSSNKVNIIWQKLIDNGVIAQASGSQSWANLSDEMLAQLKAQTGVDYQEFAVIQTYSGDDYQTAEASDLISTYAPDLAVTSGEVQKGLNLNYVVDSDYWDSPYMDENLFDVNWSDITSNESQANLLRSLFIYDDMTADEFLIHGNFSTSAYDFTNANFDSLYGLGIAAQTTFWSNQTSGLSAVTESFTAPTYTIENTAADQEADSAKIAGALSALAGDEDVILAIETALLIYEQLREYQEKINNSIGSQREYWQEKYDEAYASMPKLYKFIDSDMVIKGVDSDGDGEADRYYSVIEQAYYNRDGELETKRYNTSYNFFEVHVHDISGISPDDVPGIDTGDADFSTIDHSDYIAQAIVMNSKAIFSWAYEIRSSLNTFQLLFQVVNEASELYLTHLREMHDQELDQETKREVERNRRQNDKMSTKLNKILNTLQNDVNSGVDQVTGLISDFVSSANQAQFEKKENDIEGWGREVITEDDVAGFIGSMFFGGVTDVIDSFTGGFSYYRASMKYELAKFQTMITAANAMHSTHLFTQTLFGEEIQNKITGETKQMGGINLWARPEEGLSTGLTNFTTDFGYKIVEFLAGNTASDPSREEISKNFIKTYMGNISQTENFTNGTVFENDAAWESYIKETSEGNTISDYTADAISTDSSSEIGGIYNTLVPGESYAQTDINTILKDNVSASYTYNEDDLATGSLIHRDLGGNTAWQGELGAYTFEDPELEDSEDNSFDAIFSVLGFSAIIDNISRSIETELGDDAVDMLSFSDAPVYLDYDYEKQAAFRYRLYRFQASVSLAFMLYQTIADQILEESKPFAESMGVKPTAAGDAARKGTKQSISSELTQLRENFNKMHQATSQVVITSNGLLKSRINLVKSMQLMALKTTMTTALIIATGVVNGIAGAISGALTAMNGIPAPTPDKILAAFGMTDPTYWASAFLSLLSSIFGTVQAVSETGIERAAVMYKNPITLAHGASEVNGQTVQRKNYLAEDSNQSPYEESFLDSVIKIYQEQLSSFSSDNTFRPTIDQRVAIAEERGNDSPGYLSYMGSYFSSRVNKDMYKARRLFAGEMDEFNYIRGYDGENSEIIHRTERSAGALGLGDSGTVGSFFANQGQGSLVSDGLLSAFVNHLSKAQFMQVEMTLTVLRAILAAYEQAIEEMFGVKKLQAGSGLQDGAFDLIGGLIGIEEQIISDYQAEISQLMEAWNDSYAQDNAIVGKQWAEFQSTIELPLSGLNFIGGYNLGALFYGLATTASDAAFETTGVSLPYGAAWSNYHNDDQIALREENVAKVADESEVTVDILTEEGQRLLTESREGVDNETDRLEKVWELLRFNPFVKGNMDARVQDYQRIKESLLKESTSYNRNDKITALYEVIDESETSIFQSLYSQYDKNGDQTAYYKLDTASDNVVVKSTDDENAKDFEKYLYGITSASTTFDYQMVNMNSVMEAQDQLTRVFTLRMLIMMVEQALYHQKQQELQQMFGTMVNSGALSSAMKVIDRYNGIQLDTFNTVLEEFTSRTASKNAYEAEISRAAIAVAAMVIMSPLLFVQYSKVATGGGDKQKWKALKDAVKAGTVRAATETAGTFTYSLIMLIGVTQRLEYLEAEYFDNEDQQESEEDSSITGTEEKSKNEQIADDTLKNSGLDDASMNKTYADLKPSNAIKFSSRGGFVVNKALLAKIQSATKRRFRELTMLVQLQNKLLEAITTEIGEISGGSSVGNRNIINAVINQYLKSELSKMQQLFQGAQSLSKLQSQFLEKIRDKIAQVINDGLTEASDAITESKRKKEAKKSKKIQADQRVTNAEAAVDAAAAELEAADPDAKVAAEKKLAEAKDELKGAKDKVAKLKQKNDDEKSKEKKKEGGDKVGAAISFGLRKILETLVNPFSVIDDIVNSSENRQAEQKRKAELRKKQQKNNGEVDPKGRPNGLDNTRASSGAEHRDAERHASARARRLDFTEKLNKVYTMFMSMVMTDAMRFLELSNEEQYSDDVEIGNVEFEGEVDSDGNAVLDENGDQMEKEIANGAFERLSQTAPTYSGTTGIVSFMGTSAFENEILIAQITKSNEEAFKKILDDIIKAASRMGASMAPLLNPRNHVKLLDAVKDQLRHQEQAQELEVWEILNRALEGNEDNMDKLANKVGNFTGELTKEVFSKMLNDIVGNSADKFFKGLRDSSNPAMKTHFNLTNNNDKNDTINMRMVASFLGEGAKKAISKDFLSAGDPTAITKINDGMRSAGFVKGGFIAGMIGVMHSGLRSLENTALKNTGNISPDEKFSDNLKEFTKRSRHRPLNAPGGPHKQGYNNKKLLPNIGGENAAPEGSYDQDILEVRKLIEASKDATGMNTQTLIGQLEGATLEEVKDLQIRLTNLNREAENRENKEDSILKDINHMLEVVANQETKLKSESPIARDQRIQQSKDRDRERDFDENVKRVAVRGAVNDFMKRNRKKSDYKLRDVSSTANLYAKKEGNSEINFLVVEDNEKLRDIIVKAYEKGPIENLSIRERAEKFQEAKALIQKNKHSKESKELLQKIFEKSRDSKEFKKKNKKELQEDLNILFAHSGTQSKVHNTTMVGKVSQQIENLKAADPELFYTNEKDFSEDEKNVRTLVRDLEDLRDVYLGTRKDLSSNDKEVLRALGFDPENMSKTDITLDDFKQKYKDLKEANDKNGQSTIDEKDALKVFGRFKRHLAQNNKKELLGTLGEYEAHIIEIKSKQLSAALIKLKPKPKPKLVNVGASEPGKANEPKLSTETGNTPEADNIPELDQSTGGVPEADPINEANNEKYQEDLKKYEEDLIKYEEDLKKYEEKSKAFQSVETLSLDKEIPEELLEVLTPETVAEHKKKREEFLKKKQELKEHEVVQKFIEGRNNGVMQRNLARNGIYAFKNNKNVKANQKATERQDEIKNKISALQEEIAKEENSLQIQGAQEIAPETRTENITAFNTAIESVAAADSGNFKERLDKAVEAGETLGEGDSEKVKELIDLAVKSVVASKGADLSSEELDNLRGLIPAEYKGAQGFITQIIDTQKKNQKSKTTVGHIENRHLTAVGLFDGQARAHSSNHVQNYFFIAMLNKLGLIEVAGGEFESLEVVGRHRLKSRFNKDDDKDFYLKDKDVLYALSQKDYSKNHRKNSKKVKGENSAELITAANKINPKKTVEKVVQETIKAVLKSGNATPKQKELLRLAMRDKFDIGEDGVLTLSAALEITEAKARDTSSVEILTPAVLNAFEGIEIKEKYNLIDKRQNSGATKDTEFYFDELSKEKKKGNSPLARALRKADEVKVENLSSEEKRLLLENKQDIVTKAVNKAVNNREELTDDEKNLLLIIAREQLKVGGRTVSYDDMATVLPEDQLHDIKGDLQVLGEDNGGKQYALYASEGNTSNFISSARAAFAIRDNTKLRKGRKKDSLRSNLVVEKPFDTRKTNVLSNKPVASIKPEKTSVALPKIELRKFEEENKPVQKVSDEKLNKLKTNLEDLKAEFGAIEVNDNVEKPILEKLSKTSEPSTNSISEETIEAKFRDIEKPVAPIEPMGPAEKPVAPIETSPSSSPSVGAAEDKPAPPLAEADNNSAPSEDTVEKKIDEQELDISKVFDTSDLEFQTITYGKVGENFHQMIKDATDPDVKKKLIEIQETLTKRHQKRKDELLEDEYELNSTGRIGGVRTNFESDRPHWFDSGPKSMTEKYFKKHPGIQLDRQSAVFENDEDAGKILKKKVESLKDQYSRTSPNRNTEAKNKLDAIQGMYAVLGDLYQDSNKHLGARQMLEILSANDEFFEQVMADLYDNLSNREDKKNLEGKDTQYALMKAQVLAEAKVGDIPKLKNIFDRIERGDVKDITAGSAIVQYRRGGPDSITSSLNRMNNFSSAELRTKEGADRYRSEAAYLGASAAGNAIFAYLQDDELTEFTDDSKHLSEHERNLVESVKRKMLIANGVTPGSNSVPFKNQMNETLRNVSTASTEFFKESTVSVNSLKNMKVELDGQAANTKIAFVAKEIDQVIKSVEKDPVDPEKGQQMAAEGLARLLEKHLLSDQSISDSDAGVALLKAISQKGDDALKSVLKHMNRYTAEKILSNLYKIEVLDEGKENLNLSIKFKTAFDATYSEKSKMTDTFLKGFQYLAQLRVADADEKTAFYSNKESMENYEKFLDLAFASNDKHTQEMAANFLADTIIFLQSNSTARQTELSGESERLLIKLKESEDKRAVVEQVQLKDSEKKEGVEKTEKIETIERISQISEAVSHLDDSRLDDVKDKIAGIFGTKGVIPERKAASEAVTIMKTAIDNIDKAADLLISSKPEVMRAFIAMLQQNTVESQTSNDNLAENQKFLREVGTVVINKIGVRGYDQNTNAELVNLRNILLEVKPKGRITLEQIKEMEAKVKDSDNQENKDKLDLLKFLKSTFDTYTSIEGELMSRNNKMDYKDSTSMANEILGKNDEELKGLFDTLNEPKSGVNKPHFMHSKQYSEGQIQEVESAFKDTEQLLGLLESADPERQNLLKQQLLANPTLRTILKDSDVFEGLSNLEGLDFLSQMTKKLHEIKAEFLQITKPFNLDDIKTRQNIVKILDDRIAGSSGIERGKLSLLQEKVKEDLLNKTKQIVKNFVVNRQSFSKDEQKAILKEQQDSVLETLKDTLTSNSNLTVWEPFLIGLENSDTTAIQKLNLLDSAYKYKETMDLVSQRPVKTLLDTLRLITLQSELTSLETPEGDVEGILKAKRDVDEALLSTSTNKTEVFQALNSLGLFSPDDNERSRAVDTVQAALAVTGSSSSQVKRQKMQLTTLVLKTLNENKQYIVNATGLNVKDIRVKQSIINEAIQTVLQNPGIESDISNSAPKLAADELRVLAPNLLGTASTLQDAVFSFNSVLELEVAAKKDGIVDVKTLRILTEYYLAVKDSVGNSEDKKGKKDKSKKIDETGKNNKIQTKESLQNSINRFENARLDIGELCDRIEKYDQAGVMTEFKTRYIKIESDFENGEKELKALLPDLEAAQNTVDRIKQDLEKASDGDVEGLENRLKDAEVILQNLRNEFIDKADECSSKVYQSINEWSEDRLGDFGLTDEELIGTIDNAIVKPNDTDRDPIEIALEKINEIDDADMKAKAIRYLKAVLSSQYKEDLQQFYLRGGKVYQDARSEHTTIEPQTKFESRFVNRSVMSDTLRARQEFGDWRNNLPEGSLPTEILYKGTGVTQDNRIKIICGAFKEDLINKASLHGKAAGAAVDERLPGVLKTLSLRELYDLRRDLAATKEPLFLDEFGKQKGELSKKISETISEKIKAIDVLKRDIEQALKEIEKNPNDIEQQVKRISINLRQLDIGIEKDVLDAATKEATGGDEAKEVFKKQKEVLNSVSKLLYLRAEKALKRIENNGVTTTLSEDFEFNQNSAAFLEGQINAELAKDPKDYNKLILLSDMLGEIDPNLFTNPNTFKDLEARLKDSLVDLENGIGASQKRYVKESKAQIAYNDFAQKVAEGEDVAIDMMLDIQTPKQLDQFVEALLDQMGERVNSKENRRIVEFLFKDASSGVRNIDMLRIKGGSVKQSKNLKSLYSKLFFYMKYIATTKDKPGLFREVLEFINDNKADVGVGIGQSTAFVTNGLRETIQKTKFMGSDFFSEENMGIKEDTRMLLFEESLVKTNNVQEMEIEFKTKLIPVLDSFKNMPEGFKKQNQNKLVAQMIAKFCKYNPLFNALLRTRRDVLDLKNIRFDSKMDVSKFNEFIKEDITGNNGGVLKELILQNDWPQNRTNTAIALMLTSSSDEDRRKIMKGLLHMVNASNTGNKSLGEKKKMLQVCQQLSVYLQAFDSSNKNYKGIPEFIEKFKSLLFKAKAPTFIHENFFVDNKDSIAAKERVGMKNFSQSIVRVLKRDDIGILGPNGDILFIPNDDDPTPKLPKEFEPYKAIIYQKLRDAQSLQIKIQNNELINEISEQDKATLIKEGVLDRNGFPKKSKAYLEQEIHDAYNQLKSAYDVSMKPEREILKSDIKFLGINKDTDLNDPVTTATWCSTLMITFEQFTQLKNKLLDDRFVDGDGKITEEFIQADPIEQLLPYVRRLNKANISHNNSLINSARQLLKANQDDFEENVDEQHTKTGIEIGDIEVLQETAFNRRQKVTGKSGNEVWCEVLGITPLQLEIMLRNLRGHAFFTPDTAVTADGKNETKVNMLLDTAITTTDYSKPGKPMTLRDFYALNKQKLQKKQDVQHYQPGGKFVKVDDAFNAEVDFLRSQMNLDNNTATHITVLLKNHNAYAGGKISHDLSFMDYPEVKESLKSQPLKDGFGLELSEEAIRERLENFTKYDKTNTQLLSDLYMSGDEKDIGYVLKQLYQYINQSSDLGGYLFRDQAKGVSFINETMSNIKALKDKNPTDPSTITKAERLESRLLETVEGLSERNCAALLCDESLSEEFKEQMVERKIGPYLKASEGGKKTSEGGKAYYEFMQALVKYNNESLIIAPGYHKIMQIIQDKCYASSLKLDVRSKAGNKELPLHGAFLNSLEAILKQPDNKLNPTQLIGVINGYFNIGDYKVTDDRVILNSNGKTLVKDLRQGFKAGDSIEDNFKRVFDILKEKFGTSVNDDRMELNLREEMKIIKMEEASIKSIGTAIAGSNSKKLLETIKNLLKTEDLVQIIAFLKYSDEVTKTTYMSDLKQELALVTKGGPTVATYLYKLLSTNKSEAENLRIVSHVTSQLKFEKADQRIDKEILNGRLQEIDDIPEPFPKEFYALLDKAKLGDGRALAEVMANLDKS